MLVDHLARIAGQLLQFERELREVRPGRLDEKRDGLGRDGATERVLRVVAHPAREPVARQGFELHGDATLRELLVQFRARRRHEHEEEIRRRPREVTAEHRARILLQLVHVANHHDAPLGEHGWRTEERVERLGAQLTAATQLQVEVAGRRIRRRPRGRARQRPSWNSSSPKDVDRIEHAQPERGVERRSPADAMRRNMRTNEVRWDDRRRGRGRGWRSAPGRRSRGATAPVAPRTVRATPACPPASTPYRRRRQRGGLRRRHGGHHRREPDGGGLPRVQRAERRGETRHDDQPCSEAA